MLDRTKFTYCRQLRRCALATGPETVEIWEVPEELSRESPTAIEAPNRTIETQRSRVEGLAFVGPRHLLTVHELGTCVVWTWADTADQSSAEGDGSSGSRETKPTKAWSSDLGISVCAFRSRTRDGGLADRCALGGRSGAVVVLAFDGAPGSPTVASAQGHETDVTSFAFAPRSERLASGGRDNVICVWGADPASFEERDAPAATPSSSEDDSERTKRREPIDVEATSSRDSSNSDAGAEVAEADDAADDSTGADAQASTGADASTPTEHDDSSGKTDPETDAPLPGRRLPEPLRLTGSEGWPLALEFSGDGTRLASTALDNALYLWDPRAEDPLQALVNRHDNWVTELAWSPDDSTIATGSWDTSTGIFRAANLAPRFRFDIHTDFVSGLVFSTDSSRLFTASYDGTVAIWNWEEGSLVDRFKAHADWIEILAGIGSNRLMTVSSEDVIRIWDGEDGTKLAELGDASFEGFDLGREVDFSDYVEVPELASASLEESSRSVAALESVQRLGGGDGGKLSAEGTASDTAVGLLENAIQDSERRQATSASAPDDSTPSAEGPEMLDARLDADETREAESSEQTSASEQFIAETAGGEEEEVEEAFAEISEVDATSGAPSGPDSGGETADDEESSGPSGPGADVDADISQTADSETEEIDQFGAPLDDRIDDASLDMPEELDPSEHDTESAQADVGRTTRESENEEELPDPGASPTSGSTPSPDDATTRTTSPTSSTEGGGSRDAPSIEPADAPTGLSDSPSPKLGRPATEQSSDRLASADGEGAPRNKHGDPEQGREERDTMNASGSDIASNMHTPQEGDAESFERTDRREEGTDPHGRPGMGERKDSERPDAPSMDASPSSSAASGETRVESEAESSPSADDLKSKFQKLKEKKAELDAEGREHSDSSGEDTSSAKPDSPEANSDRRDDSDSDHSET